jgi:predicted transcriptional regulator
MKTRNLTLTIREDLVRQLKIVAAKRDTSISAMVTRALWQIVDEESGYAEAQGAMLEDLRKGYSLGTRAEKLAGKGVTYTNDRFAGTNIPTSCNPVAGRQWNSHG